LRISKTTETTMRMPVPPMARPAIPVIPETMEGKIATRPKNDAPTKVILFKTKFK